MQSPRVRCLLGIALLTAFAGCGGTGESEGSEKVGSGKLEIFPPEIFSGTDGTHTFKAPVIAVNYDEPVKWTIADPSIAQLAPADADNEHCMITVLKTGETSVTATSGAATFTAKLHVVPYTAQEYSDGEKRYMMGADMQNPPCKECHAPGKGPDHTSTELDADPDSQVQNTFLTGVDPEDRPIKDHSEFSELLKGKTHKWMVTESEKVGLVAYLRGLPPMGYPPYDAPTTDKENE
ncbi:MAG TPA: hypothetical protein VJV78_35295 [Polyangiales bacterium]|nr:hypothetical protein [Polyangiales bacterium]